MANWKIQDIAPPKKLRQKAEELLAPEKPKKGGSRKQKGVSWWLVRAVLPVFVLAVISLGAIHVFFAKAEVSLWPETRQIKVLEPITAEVGRSEADLKERIIPASTMTTEKTATRLFDASSRTVKEDRATGTIRVFNAYTTSPYTLIAQTRFLSEGNKLFRTPSRITIPAMTDQGPGFVDVEMVAAEAGADYNIGPASFSVPGLSGFAAYTAIYAKSTEPMSGGSEREVPVVSEQDIEQAKDALTEELTQKAAEELLAKVPEDMAASKDSVVVEVEKAESLVQPGAELEQFNVTVSLKATAFLFPKADLEALAEELLSGELAEGERLAKEKTQIGFEQIALGAGDSAGLELKVDAAAYSYIDPTELKIRLRGKSKEEAAGILASYGSFKKTEISLRPFWRSFLPKGVDSLNITFVIDPAPNL